MHVVHIASELAPIAKVGGLADVLLGLCRELSSKGLDVDIILPKYDCLDTSGVRDLAIHTRNFPSFFGQDHFPNTVWVGWVENLKVYFIEPHHPRYFFNRGCFYGCEDDIDRYLYFIRAAIDFLALEKIVPDILHLHDWQTAAAAPLLKTSLKEVFSKTRVVSTIHNIDYQGKCDKKNLLSIGLDPTTTELLDPQNPLGANLLACMIAYSDFVTTVSPGYAKEVLTPEGGRGLHTLLLRKKEHFAGILNGIDSIYWNPETDRYLPAHFSYRVEPDGKNDRKTIDKKAFCKRVLRERLRLFEEWRPIVGCIARLVPQKGISLIKHAIQRTLEKKGQFILLGSSPIPAIAEEFYDLKMRFNAHPHVHLILHHQEELAHLIYAGADLFIIPSIFEPCGLTQMIALKYGTIPIVRKTGGLADTIVDVNEADPPSDKAKGYVFEAADNAGVNSALDRAIDAWFHRPEMWRSLMIEGMQYDFSWKASSKKYIALYETLLSCNRSEGAI